MKITASGIAKFHFWGTYSQSFYLSFETPEEALLALPVLGALKLTEEGTNAGGQTVLPGQWKAHEKLCGVFASGSDIARIEAQLVALGADEDAIGSMKSSIDHGGRFQITIEIEDPAQVLMAF